MSKKTYALNKKKMMDTAVTADITDIPGISDKEKKKVNIKKIFTNNFMMLGYVWKYKPSLIFMSFLTAILSVRWTLMNVLYLNYMINAIMLKSSFNEICNISAIMLVSFLLAGAYDAWYQEYYYPKSTLEVNKAIQKELFRKAVSVEMECFDNTEFYDKYIRAVQEANNRAINILQTISKVFENILVIGTIITVIALLEPLMIVFAFTSVLFSMLINFMKSKKQFNQSLENTPLNRESDYITRVFYLQQYAKELRTSNFWLTLLTKFDTTTNNLIRVIKKYSFTFGTINFASSSINIIYLIAMLIYISWKIIVKKTLLIGNIVALLNGVFQLSNSLGTLFTTANQLYQHSLYVDNLKLFIDYSPRIVSNIDGLKVEEAKHDIKINNLEFTYPGQDTPTLKNINLDIKAGQKVAFVGHNGAGKTSLIKLLIRLYDPIEGSLTLNDENYKKYNVESLRSAFGTVFQDFQYYATTIAENVLQREVLVGKEKEDEAHVWEALEQSGLAEKVSALPRTIYTPVSKEFNEDGVMFSGGELQKLALARVFANTSSIIILDEPSSALDPIAEHEMHENMMKAADGKTVILISHRLSTTIMADTIYLLEHGQIIESGTHDELMVIGGKYAEMFNIQAESYINSTQSA